MRTGKLELFGFALIFFAGSAVFANQTPALAQLSSSVLSALSLNGAKHTVVIAPEKIFITPTNLEAKAVYIFDISTGNTIYEQNASTTLPLASITKIMTALTTYEHAPQSATVLIRPEDLAKEGDSGLLSNEHWRLKDLIDFALTSSSNDAASALASVTSAMGATSTEVRDEKAEFVRLMNEQAQKIGMTQSQFNNESGLDLDTLNAGAYASAKDVTMLFAYILAEHPDLLEATRYERVGFTSLDDIHHTARNTNASINSIPGIIASKTGLTDLAGGNLVISFDAGINRPIIITVLGSSEKGRFSDMEALASSTLAFLREE